MWNKCKERKRIWLLVFFFSSSFGSFSLHFMLHLNCKIFCKRHFKNGWILHCSYRTLYDFSSIIHLEFEALVFFSLVIQQNSHLSILLFGERYVRQQDGYAMLCIPSTQFNSLRSWYIFSKFVLFSLFNTTTTMTLTTTTTISIKIAFILIDFHIKH